VKLSPLKSTLALLALAILAFAASAAPASAAQTATMGAISDVSYATAHVSGEINADGAYTGYSFQYSTDEVEWTGAGGGESFGSTSETVQADITVPKAGTKYFVRLALTDEFGNVSATSPEPNPFFTTLSADPPTVEIDAVTTHTDTTAHFSGQINPNAPEAAPTSAAVEAGFKSDWHFECTPECPGLQGGTVAADNSGHTVEADTSGLLHNTDYEVRLIATNASGTEIDSKTFKTEAVAPEAISKPVGTVGPTSAVLGGTVDPNGTETVYWIEYATNESFAGATIIPASKDASAGTGQDPVLVSKAISGLQPGSDYFFRIVAESVVDTVVSATQSFQTLASTSGQACPNETFRAGPAAPMADCRAYELVSTNLDLTHTTLGLTPAGRGLASGNAFSYTTIDAPNDARSGSVFNVSRATRDQATGWHAVSLSEPLTTPTTAYFSFSVFGLSPDLSHTFDVSDQPLAGPTTPDGQNAFRGLPDGSYQLMTTTGSEANPFVHFYIVPEMTWGNSDFSHIYFVPQIAQAGTTDPLATGGNIYSWSSTNGLKLVAILPGETAAPNGGSLAWELQSAHLQPASEDGRFVSFRADGKLYLRINESQTVEYGATQRVVDPDPNPPAPPSPAGVAADGSKVIFTSSSELTDDANTGESGGMTTDAGNDLYSYDTTSGVLTDLTVDNEPVDAAAGADVQKVLGMTSDGSYIYFTANGVLADGAAAGHTSLYVWHDGANRFVAAADNLQIDGNGHADFYMTPDGQHIAFGSRDSLTGYDNRDPVTNQPHSEVFTATPGGRIECASCRANGTRPTGDSSVPRYRGIQPTAAIRSVSDDGSRVFFHSTDAVIPQASSGVQQVFEYSNRRTTPISRPDSPKKATFLDASADGRDVFFSTYDDLVPRPTSGDDGVYDAREGGGFPVTEPERCAGVSCQGEQASVPPAVRPGSSLISGSGNRHPMRPCKKGTVRRRGKCVNKHSGKKHSGKKHGKARQPRQPGGSK
jgi:hypothetical protein